MNLYWVQFPRGVVGLTEENGVVVDAHESIRWAIGRQLSEVSRMVRERFGEVVTAAAPPSPVGGDAK